MSVQNVRVVANINNWEYYSNWDTVVVYTGGVPVKRCIGQSVPIWVNESDFHRYIYGVQGPDAMDCICVLECFYEFPDGTACAIDKCEFKNEPLQMVRFDFRIR